MSGILPLVYLLTHNTGMQALVDVSAIVPGDLPLKLPLPAMNLEHADGMPRNTISMLEPNRAWRDRIQVTAHVDSPSASVPGLGYPGLTAMLNAAIAACPNQFGIVNGIFVLSILPDIRGPFMSFMDSAHVAQSQDFIVNWRT